ncbi:LuxR C-terminal-related transcriptional regulator [Bryobacter aggregatus]|uniref:LuxR C-terminal-related transcriptional regulator n=1 Tax=Bryobacter aggregatus TaxID=360054 RepID=UPI00068B3BD4|nr:response regulator transcription factor [Bryobacter aggregatus]
MQLIGAASTPRDAIAKVSELQPDIVMIDQSSGLRPVFSFLTEMKIASPSSRTVLWVLELAEIECFRALQLGARGILRRTLPIVTLLDCLRSVGAGNLWLENSISDQVVGFLNRKNTTRLTPREREIVRAVCRGMKNKEVADLLQITAGTVKVHLMHIFEKTGVKDRFELAAQGPKLLGLDQDERISASS